MREKTRDALRKALFEAFFVVLAVALALAANEWRQARADRQQARSALASIVEELKSNRAAVESSRDYHRDRLQLIARLQRESAAPRDPAPGALRRDADLAGAPPLRRRVSGG